MSVRMLTSARRAFLLRLETLVQVGGGAQAADVDGEDAAQDEAEDRHGREQFGQCHSVLPLEPRPDARTHCLARS